MKKSSHPEAPDPADYSFQNLPGDETAACKTYEYGREGRLIQERVTEVRNAKAEVQAAIPQGLVQVDADHEDVGPGQSERATGVILVHAEGTRVSKPLRCPLPKYGDPERFADLIRILAETDEFPSVPWQKLPGVVKQGLVSELTREWPEPVPPLIIRSGNLHETLENFARGVEFHFPEMAGTGVVLEGFTRIELEYDPKEMAQEFLRQYVELRRKAGISISRKFDRTETSLRLLQELGALRLRHPRYGLSQKEAGELLNTYEDRGRYHRACKAAIEHFRQYFALSDSEFPIHSSEGFRR